MNSLHFIHLNKVTLYALVACGLLALMLLVPARSAHASALVVTNTNDSGAGSLRQAILDANANSGADTITFAIGNGAQTIAPESGLPQITDAVTLDGTTQPGYAGAPLIELDGENAGYGVIGLDVAANNCTLQGLVINRFSGNGIRLMGSNNLITHNYIGTDVSGTLAYGNGTYGVVQYAGLYLNATTSSADNEIRENVVSGNQYVGILIQGEANTTKIQGNKIGTTPDGQTALANGDNGIQIGPGGANTLIGGTEAGKGNLVSGNGWHGIAIAAASGPTRIEGNLIGTDGAGENAYGNYACGVWTNSADATIGGSLPGAGNLIAANAVGIYLTGSNGAIVQGNYIGTNKEGTFIISNSLHGVWINSAAINSQIGGTAAGAGNVISGNGALGIYLTDAGTDNTQIQGNRIGTSADGYAQVGNGQNGIYADRGTTNTTIGGATPGAGNVISGNGWNGIANNFNASMVVQGNRIGTNIAGNSCLGNGGEGIFLTEGATIGGISQDAGNIIACNASDGIEVCGSYSCPEVPKASRAIRDENFVTMRPFTANSADQPAAPSQSKDNAAPKGNTPATITSIQNNHIGTDSTGQVNLGNAEEGIVLWNIDGNQVSDNVIAFHPGYGIHVASGSGNILQRNTIAASGKDGVYITGGGINTLLENTITNSLRDGVRVSANQNEIKNNTITGNTQNGVLILGGTGNALRGNSIYTNGALGIDLAPEGVTANDTGDKDKGANKKQNFPVLTSASGKTGKVKGSLNSIPNKNFTIEFFANEKCDANRYGEGKTLLGQKTVKTDSYGNNTFSFKATGLVAGQYVTVTATDTKGNTSEFSKCIKIK